MSGDFRLLPRVANGAIAAIIGAGSVFPLDLVKTRLQNQHIGPNGERAYNSMFDAFIKIAKNEGFKGLYRGLMVNLTWVGPEKGLKLACNDLLRYWLSVEGQRLSLIRQTIAGAGTGMFQTLLSCPTELLKIQLQDSGRVAAEAAAAGKPMKRITGISVAAKIFRENGIAGFYKGLSATGWRDITFALIYFPLYASVSDAGPKTPEGDPPFYWNFISGILAGAVCAWLCTPFDVLKTRMQAYAKSEGQRVYSGIWDCFTYTYSKEGLKAFFKGGMCRITVIAPLYGITQTVYYIGVAEMLFGLEKQRLVK